MMNDKALKKRIREWWNENPMIYNWYKKDKIFNFKEIDNRVREISWFAQKKGQPIFSSLINYEFLKGKKVLEVGCGIGTITEEFAKQGIDIVGIDLAHSATKNTNERPRLKGKIIEADAEELPFKNESFDYVWCWGVLHHTPDTEKAINEIYRVLKNGGYVGVMIYHKNSFRYWFHLMFIRGILQLKLLKFSPQQIANRYTDGSPVGGNPLAKHFTKEEARKLFKKYKNIKISVYGLKDEIIPKIHRYPGMHKIIPNTIAKLLLGRWGWFLFITAFK